MNLNHLGSKIFQHEIDHLDGILLTDKVPGNIPKMHYDTMQNFKFRPDSEVREILSKAARIK